ncbi:MAG TPA: hypothetical protein VMU87_18135 [Stellaceae bacterium]|nr:hypothetical protein [Stellaceae bacterium]
MIVWALWLGLAILSFAALETVAFRTGRWPSLSLATWRVFQAFPLIAVVFGMVFGALAVHFFWHWCPPGSMSAG